MINWGSSSASPKTSRQFSVKENHLNYIAGIYSIIDFFNFIGKNPWMPIGYSIGNFSLQINPFHRPQGNQQGTRFKAQGSGSAEAITMSLSLVPWTLYLEPSK